MGKGLSITAFVLSFLFFIPFASTVGLVLGIIALVKGNKLKGKAKKNYGKGYAIGAVTVGAIFAIFNLIFSFIIIAAVIQSLIPVDYTAGGLTDESGALIIEIEGEEVALIFTDEVTGEPIQNLSVGFAKDEYQGLAVAVVLDHTETYPPQFHVIYDEDSYLGFLTGAAVGTNTPPNDIPLPVTKISNQVIVGSAGKLPGVGDDISDASVIKDLLGLGIKVLKVAVPSDIQKELASKYNLDVGTTETLTLEEARARIAKEKQDNKLSSLVTMPLSSPAGALAGTTLSMTSSYVDSTAVGVCESVGSASGIEITTIGPFMYYGNCNYGADLPAWPTVIDTPTSGSLELFSKTNLGYGVKIDLEAGENVVFLPAGDYETIVKVDDEKPVIQTITMPEEEATFTLDSGSYTIEEKPKLIFTAATLERGTENQEYSASVGTITGGESPYYYYQGEGFLPSGVYLYDGTIEGTPYEVGSFTLEICVEDYNFQLSCDEITLTINEDEGECDSISECEVLYGDGYDCYDKYCQMIGDCVSDSDCTSLYGSDYECSSWYCVYDYSSFDDSSSDSSSSGSSDSSSDCGSVPVYDDSHCAGLPSYPTFAYEACLTQAQDDHYNNQVAYNACMGF